MPTTTLHLRRLKVFAPDSSQDGKFFRGRNGEVFQEVLKIQISEVKTVLLVKAVQLTLLPWESILKLKGVYKNTLYFCNLF
jgi:hypothetical protein